MSGILLTSVSGLEGNQQMLDTVGNNLANSNTTGYKSQTTLFSDLVYQTLAPASIGSAGVTGGTNPVQVGSGVQVATIESNLSQGTLEQTGNELDMALQGNGYFVVNSGNQNLYTRAGSFGVDAHNYLVDPTTGFRVQRFGTLGNATATSPGFQVAGTNDIKIPYGTVVPGTATSLITLQGNLSASAVGPLAQTLTSTLPFQSGGNPATGATLLSSLDDVTTPYVNGDKITLTGLTTTGTPVNATLAVGPATKLSDVVAAINADFPGSTASIDSKGNIVVTANQTGPSKLALTISDAPGNTGSYPWSNHATNVTTAGKDGDTVSTSIQVFDAQGAGHTLSMVFQKQANGTWTLTGSLPSADGTMIASTVSGITFNANGSLRQVSGNSSFTVQFLGQPASQQINFSFGSPGGFDGLTNVGGSSSAEATSQNGSSAGFLTTVSIANDGTVTGVFSNGQTLPIAQIAVANFANPAALSRQGSNYYAVTTNSGPALIGAGDSGGRGSVEQKELEDSNVDISLEFTRLIVAQRGFEANAKALTTADQVLQALDQIIQ
jgi:flagellar hook protein FlgE